MLIVRKRLAVDYTSCIVSVVDLYRNHPKFSDTHVLANKVDIEEQSDQGLHCLPLLLHLLDTLIYRIATLFKIKGDYSNVFGCPNLLDCYVFLSLVGAQPVNVKSHIQTLKVTSMPRVIRIVLFLLLLVYGIEANPGPGFGDNARGNGPPRGRGSDRGSDRDSDRGRGSNRFWLSALDTRTTRRTTQAREASQSSQMSPEAHSTM